MVGAVRSFNIDFRANTSSFQKGLSESERSAKRLQNQLDRNVSQLRTDLTQAMRLAASVAAGLGIQTTLQGIAGALKDAGVAAVKSAAQYELNQIAFGALIGSAKDAKVVLSELTQFAIKTPFRLPELEAAARQLLGFGFAAHELVPAIKLIGAHAAGTGADIVEIAYAFGQTRAETKVLSKDLRQFTSRGVIDIKSLAAHFQTTEQGVFDLAEEGRIAFKDILELMQLNVAEGGKFSTIIDDTAKSMSGLASIIADSLDIALRDMTLEMLRFVKAGEAMQGIVDHLGDMGTLAQRVGVSIGALAQIIYEVDRALLSFTDRNPLPEIGNILAQGALRTAQIERDAKAALENQGIDAGPSLNTSDEEEKQRKAVQAILGPLREKWELLGMTEDRILRYKLTNIGATKGEIDMALAMQETINRLKEREEAEKKAEQARQDRLRESASLYGDLAKEAQKTIDDQKNPLEKFKERLGELAKQFAFGFLNPEQLTNGINDARAELADATKAAAPGEALERGSGALIAALNESRRESSAKDPVATNTKVGNELLKEIIGILRGNSSFKLTVGSLG